MNLWMLILMFGPIHSVRIRKHWVKGQLNDEVNRKDFEHNVTDHSCANANHSADQIANFVLSDQSKNCGKDRNVFDQSQQCDEPNDRGKKANHSVDSLESDQCLNNKSKSERKCKFADHQKLRITNQYNHFISAYLRKGNHSKNEWGKFLKKLANVLGVKGRTITKWKKQLGIDVEKKHTDEERMAKLEIYYKIKRQNPKMAFADVAEELGISMGTLINWKSKFKGIGQSANQSEESIKQQRKSSKTGQASISPTKSFSSNDAFWAWKKSAKKRTVRIVL